MKKKYLFCFFVFNIYYTFSYSQDVIKTIDSTKKNSEWAILEYSCILAKESGNKNFTKNEILYDFYIQIVKNKTFKIVDTFEVLNNLLTLAEKNTDKSCLLPFLRLIDENADAVYKENCRTVARKMPFRNYCEEPSIQFLVLFYIQFVIADPLIVEDGFRFSKIQLKRKDIFDQTSLTQEDYSAIYNEYKIWLANKYIDKCKRNYNPLKYSNYEWYIEDVLSSEYK